jgi:hypothetical protein
MTAELDLDSLKMLVREILATTPGEIGCDECFDQLDRFVELELAGRSAAEALPRVQKHLERCADCHEEYDALLTASRGIATSA